MAYDEGLSSLSTVLRIWKGAIVIVLLYVRWRKISEQLLLEVNVDLGSNSK